MKGSAQLQEAMLRGQIEEGDYFMPQHPANGNTLWELKLCDGEHVMFGPTTKEKLIIRREKDWRSLGETANMLAQKEFNCPAIFSKVEACGSGTVYICNDSYEADNVIRKLSKIYCSKPDEEYQRYLLNVTIVIGEYHYQVLSFKDNPFGLRVCGSRLVKEPWYEPNGALRTPIYSREVRAQAILNPYARIRMDGCDGSARKPWIIIPYQEEPEIPAKKSFISLFNKRKKR